MSKLLANDNDEYDELPDELFYPEVGGITRYTDDEVLALIEDTKLSGNQYEVIRIQAKAKDADDIYQPTGA